VLLAGGFIFWRLVTTAARWGREFIELGEHGVVTTGKVLRKVRESRRHGGENRYLRYEYVDQFGTTHVRKKMMVTNEAWESLEEGGPIAIVYSQRDPAINAPQYLIDTMERAEPPQKLKDAVERARQDGTS
ncbi:MAG TPA: hypothetical protein VF147_12695, partial [Vicinamibacterales bacterium]